MIQEKCRVDCNILAILVATELKLCVIAPFSIGAMILSYHVGKFMLITAFLLFSMGYLDMMLGLVSQQHTKPKHSIPMWRAGDDTSTLPMHTRDITRPNNSETKLT